MTATVATAKDRYLAEFEAVERLGAFRSPSWLAPPGVEWPRLVFVDGRYSPKLSTARPLPGGGQVASLAEAMITEGDMIERHLGRHARWDGNVFAALNTAFVQDGGFVCLPPEARGETPIELVFLATTPGVVAQPRTLI